MALPEILTLAERRERFGLDETPELVWKNWEPGTESIKDILLRNIWTTPCKVKYQLPATKYFSMNFPEQHVLSPGMAFLTKIAFQPQQKEQYDDQVVFEVERNGVKGKFAIPVRAVLPVLSIHVPERVNVGNVAVKETTTQKFTLRNTSQLETSFKWEVPEPFHLAPMQGVLKPRGTKVGGTALDVAEITCTFAPKEAATMTATAVVRAWATDTDEYRGITTEGATDIRGVGKYAFVALSHDRIHFGDVPTGPAVVQKLRVSNRVEVKARWSISLLTDPKIAQSQIPTPFSFSPHAGTLEPLQEIEVSVRYHPTTSGLQSINAFRFKFPGGTAEVHCEGYAIGPQMELSTNLINFGDLKPEETTARALTVFNRSKIPVTVQFTCEKDAIFQFEWTSYTLPPYSDKAVTIHFRGSYAMNYCRRVFLLIENQDPLWVDLLATVFEDTAGRPPQFAERHLLRFRERARRGLDIYPPESVERAEREKSAIGEMRRPEDPAIVEYLRPCADNTRPVWLSVNDIDFDATISGGTPSVRQVTLTNSTNGKVTVVWHMPGVYDTTIPVGKKAPALPPFSVYPSRADIDARRSMTFDVSFAPKRPSVFYGQELECYIIYKTMRNFRLITDETFCPPWCLTLTAVGHTFPKGTEYTNDTSKVEFWGLGGPLRSLSFTPARVGEAAFLSVCMKNAGDTPVKYAVYPDSTSPFACWPPVGVLAGNLPRVLVLSFRPAEPLVHARNMRLIINNNANPSSSLNLNLTGFSDKPSMSLGAGDGAPILFRPTLIGSYATREYPITNNSGLPVYYKWHVPRLYPELEVANGVGSVRGGETMQCLFTFMPGHARKFPMRAFLQVAADPIPEMGETYAKEENVPESFLPVRVHGEGSVGYLRFEPATVEFDRTAIGASATREVCVYNDGDCDIAVSFFFERNWEILPGEEEVRRETSFASLQEAAAAQPTANPSWQEALNYPAGNGSSGQPTTLATLGALGALNGSGAGSGGQRRNGDPTPDSILHLSGALPGPTSPQDSYTVGNTHTSPQAAFRNTEYAGSYSPDGPQDDGSLTFQPLSLLIPSRAHELIRMTFSPKHRILYKYHGSFRFDIIRPEGVPPSRGGLDSRESRRSEPDVRSESFVAFDVMGRGVLPSVTVSDVWAPADPKHLWWERLSLDRLNAEMERDLSSAEVAFVEYRTRPDVGPTERNLVHDLPDFLFDVGARELNSEPLRVRLELRNRGPVDVRWSLLFPNDLEWSELYSMAEKDLRNELLRNERIFSAEPKEGVIPAGRAQCLELTYHHLVAAVNEIDAVLSVDKGKQVRLLLRGTTLEPGTPYLHFSSLEHAFARVPIGAEHPFVQTQWLRNEGAVTVEWSLDLDDLARVKAEHHDFDIFSCLNPTGTLEPGAHAPVRWTFRPLESLRYEAEIAVVMCDPMSGATRRQPILLSGEGYHPDVTTEVQSAEPTSMPSAASFALVPFVPGSRGAAGQDGRAQLAFLSVERVSFQQVPLHSINRCFLAVSNFDSQRTVRFTWRLEQMGRDYAAYTVVPSTGVLGPLEHCACRLVFTPAQEPEIYEFDIACWLEDVSPIEEIPPTPISVVDPNDIVDVPKGSLSLRAARQSAPAQRTRLSAVTGRPMTGARPAPTPPRSASRAVRLRSLRDGGFSPRMETMDYRKRLEPQQTYVHVSARSYRVDQFKMLFGGYSAFFVPFYARKDVWREPQRGESAKPTVTRLLQMSSSPNEEELKFQVESVIADLLQDIIFDPDIQFTIEAVEKAPIPFYAQLVPRLAGPVVARVSAEQGEPERAASLELPALSLGGESAQPGSGPVTARSLVDESDTLADQRLDTSSLPDLQHPDDLGVLPPGEEEHDEAEDSARILLVPEFQELAESVMEGTLFNLLEEALFGEFSLVEPPRLFTRGVKTPVPPPPAIIGIEAASAARSITATPSTAPRDITPSPNPLGLAVPVAQRAGRLGESNVNSFASISESTALQASASNFGRSSNNNDLTRSGSFARSQSFTRSNTGARGSKAPLPDIASAASSAKRSGAAD